MAKGYVFFEFVQSQWFTPKQWGISTQENLGVKRFFCNQEFDIVQAGQHSDILRWDMHHLETSYLHTAQVDRPMFECRGYKTGELK